MLERFKAVARRRVIRDGAWVAAGQVISAAALLVGTRVTTGIVRDTSVMGTVNLIIGAIATARFVIFAPILQAQVRFYPEFASRGRVGALRRTTERLLWPMLAAAALLTLLAGAAYSHYEPNVSRWTFAAAAGLLVVDIGRTFESNFFQAARRQKVVSAMNVAEAVARPGLMVAAVWWFGAAPHVVIFGYLAGTGAVYLASLARFHREGIGADDGTTPAAAAAAAAGTDPGAGPGPTARDLWRYGLPLAPLSILGCITAFGDRYIIGSALGTADVGVYTISYGLMSQPFLLAQGIVARTLSPIYYKAVSDRDHRTERKTFRAWICTSVAVAAAGLVAVLLFRGLIARLLLKGSYGSGVALMPWIAAGYALYGVATVFETKLYAAKRTGRVLVGNAIVAAAAIAAPLGLMYKWGMLGVAAACPVYFGIQVLVMVALTRDIRPSEEA